MYQTFRQGSSFGVTLWRTALGAAVLNCPTEKLSSKFLEALGLRGNYFGIIRYMINQHHPLRHLRQIEFNALHKLPRAYYMKISLSLVLWFLFSLPLFYPYIHYRYHYIHDNDHHYRHHHHHHRHPDNDPTVPPTRNIFFLILRLVIIVIIT